MEFRSAMKVIERLANTQPQVDRGGKFLNRINGRGKTRPYAARHQGVNSMTFRPLYRENPHVTARIKLI